MSRTPMTSMDRSHPAGPAPAGDSVMFSLSALLAKEEAAAPPASATGSRATQDGSGLIDLSMLAGGPIQVPAHVHVLPFGPPPAPPVVTELAPAPVPRAPARTWALAALAVAAAGGLMAVFLFTPRAEPGPPAVAGLATATSALAARLPPIAPPRAPEPPAPPPAVRAEDAVGAGRDSAFAGSNRLPSNRTPGDRPKDPRATREPPKVPPPADPCHGDLLCAMRRATH
jgi:hypothetical protein